MLDLVGNPNCWFSHAQAHILVGLQISIMKAVALGLLALFCVVGLVFGQYPGYGYRQGGAGGGGCESLLYI